MTTPSFRWAGLTVDCADPRRLGAFWSALLGGELSEPLPGWVRLRAADDAVPVVNFQPVPERKQGKTRIHLDVAVADVERAVTTVLRLGGRSLGQRYDYDEGVVEIMADPEGNEFCLVQYFR